MQNKGLYQRKDLIKQRICPSTQHGLEIFMEEQKEKYTCPKCDGIFLSMIGSVASVKKKD